MNYFPLPYFQWTHLVSSIAFFVNSNCWEHLAAKHNLRKLTQITHATDAEDAIPDLVDEYAEFAKNLVRSIVTNVFIASRPGVLLSGNILHQIGTIGEITSVIENICG